MHGGHASPSDTPRAPILAAGRRSARVHRRTTEECTPGPIQTLGLPYSCVCVFFLNENVEQILKRLMSCLTPQFCPHISCEFQKAMKTRIFSLNHLRAKPYLL